MRQWLALATTMDDRMNPIAVKEFRQAVQSRGVIAILLLFLLVNLGVIGGYVMLASDAETSIDGGRNVFIGLLGILQFTCMILVPLYAGGRMSQERNNTDLDLLYVTTLSPGAIVRGKYLATTALTLLIFSASMPFMILTYLLRGIDLPTIFFVIATSFLICSMANAVGITVGCIPAKGAFRGLGYISFFIFMPMFPSVLSMLSIYITRGMGWRMGTWIFWASTATYLLCAAFLIGLLYVYSVALLSPKPTNRMFLPRLYLTVGWAVVGIVAGCWSLHEKTFEPILVWMYCSGAALMFLTVAALGERDAWTSRVRRTIPRSPMLRPLAFLLYTGSAGGILWCVLLFAATMLAANVWSTLGAGFSKSAELAVMRGNLTMVFGYILCYCLTTAALRPTLFRKIPTVNLSVFAAFLGMAASLAPYLIAFLVEKNLWIAVPWYLLGSPIVLSMTNEAAKDAAGVFLILWLLGAVLASAPWAIGQWRRFMPYRTMVAREDCDEIIQ